MRCCESGPPRDTAISIPDAGNVADGHLSKQFAAKGTYRVGGCRTERSELEAILYRADGLDTPVSHWDHGTVNGLTLQSDVRLLAGFSFSLSPGLDGEALSKPVEYFITWA